jgi:hypothetical protein
MSDPIFSFLPDSSREQEPSSLCVFQIEETSSDSGGYSLCWVTKESDGFYMYGNELGCMAGPCTTVDGAMNISMFQFGMNEWNLRCFLKPEELSVILTSPAFILSNVDSVIINDVDTLFPTIAAIVECYRHWRRGRVLDVTVIFGPPADVETQKSIEDRHKEDGTSKDKLWVELVHLVLHDLNHRESIEEPTALNNLFGDFLSQPVTVHDLFLTATLLDGIQYPAFQFCPDKISNSEGWPIVYDWSEASWREALCHLFGILLKSEWVRLSFAYET